MGKLKNFNEWSLNEKLELDTEITTEKLVPIDILFAEKYYDMFLNINEMNEGSEEDDCIGELIFRAAGEDWYFDNAKYNLLNWFFGRIVDANTGELDPTIESADADSIWDGGQKHFEEQSTIVTLEEARNRIDDFLSLEQNKCKTMLYLYELCYQIHNKTDKPEVLENSRYYTDTDIWDLVIDFVKKSHQDFPSILDMIPEWYGIDNVLHLLPLNPDYKEKFKGRLQGRKFGL